MHDHYFTVSLSQKSRVHLNYTLWLRIPHKAAVTMSVEGMVMIRFKWGSVGFSAHSVVVARFSFFPVIGQRLSVSHWLLAKSFPQLLTIYIYVCFFMGQLTTWQPASSSGEWWETKVAVFYNLTLEMTSHHFAIFCLLKPCHYVPPTFKESK